MCFLTCQEPAARKVSRSRTPPRRVKRIDYDEAFGIRLWEGLKRSKTPSPASSDDEAAMEPPNLPQPEAPTAAAAGEQPEDSRFQEHRVWRNRDVLAFFW